MGSDVSYSNLRQNSVFKKNKKKYFFKFIKMTLVHKTII